MSPGVISFEMEGTETESGAARGHPLPMNSKRLTGAHLQRIACTLKLPMGGSKEETRQLIDGKLMGMGKEPRNVQVLVRQLSEAEESLALVDMDGIFLEIVNPDPESESGERADEPTDTGEPSDLEGQLEAVRARNEELEAGMTDLTSELEREQKRLSDLSVELERERGRVSDMWKMNCAQLAVFDETVAAKDTEIQRLQQRIEELEAVAPGAGVRRTVVTPTTTPLSPTTTPLSLTTTPLLPGRTLVDTTPVSSTARTVTVRRGKAPPVGEFTAEDIEVQLDDWLPSLERASVWNSWSEEERLMQLAGHLKGRALQEWNLMRTEDKSTFASAVQGLRTRIDPGSKALAAQDFRHTAQKEGEAVADFIRRLERTFRVAYGRDMMSGETRDTLLYGQLQEGLRYELMRAPAVSGATEYNGLCVAAKNEEKHLSDLKKRQQYLKPPLPSTNRPKVTPQESSKNPTDRGDRPPYSNRPARRCFICKKPGHLMRDCRAKRSESKGSSQPAATRQVTTETESSSILELLYSSDSDDGSHVNQITVTDGGSKSQLARVDIQGVPADGVVDTGAEITIIGRELFARVASVAHLRKKDFRKADKVPRNYDGKTFHLDGCIDLDISFAGKTMKTTVYIKADACDQLLLSEGVCRQLCIVSYHPSVQPRKAGSRQRDSPVVPTVRVQLVEALRLPPCQSVVVEVDLEGGGDQLGQPLFVERKGDAAEMSGLTLEEAVIAQQENGFAKLVITNCSGFTQTLAGGTCVGLAEQVEVVDPESDEDQDTDVELASIRRVTSLTAEERKRLLLETINLPNLPDAELDHLKDFLAEHHDVFSLEEGERGETGLTQLEIDTGDATPVKQPPRRMPFVVRQEVAKHLKQMQQSGVIQPSSSPWSSPVVIVRKRDGTHRFCVDYRGLNAVTKPDAFPLPRISDILDQLGGVQYFSTLDLASGFWQILVDPQSREKTAFTTPHGLFEFRVMPFGLTNAPAVFQRLMQEVLAGLNPEDGKAFVSVYIDDILVFSPTLEEHLDHLKRVMARLRKAFLKLKPVKCKFVREEVEHLGHVLTKQGVQTNRRLTEAVQDFPRPRNIHDIRRFLGLSSYYRRFIPNFAKIAQPLHQLTSKGVPFVWSAECEAAFTTLKGKLTVSPVLAYPSFDRGFTLETDASIQGLGAVLSQQQEDGKLHPVAYASRALNHSEKNYSVTELETLAVVWAITHFHSYLYGNCVHVLTDHSTVKAVLETPNPTGKHARWWTRVYGRGVRDVRITYRAGRENVAADALSRSPRDPAPLCGVAQNETQVAIIRGDVEDTSMAVNSEPSQELKQSNYAVEQSRDADLCEMMRFLRDGTVPADECKARKLAAQGSMFSLVDGILYYIDHRRSNQKRAVVPHHLRKGVLQESHRGVYSGHFAGNKLYNALVKHWYWEGMYADTMAFCKKCPECVIATGGQRQHKPYLQPIPVQRPFQIIGVDIMDLPCTESGNKHVIVFQDMFTKWPMVFPVPDQKSVRIARLLCEEIVPLFGVPEALLSDRGTNLLSHLMLDVCTLLGVTKLNTTAYHPECDGMIERFNRTLKTMLRKRVSQFGAQWDKHLSGVLWAYRNTPHDSTGEKPSFLLFGWDCRSPLEATLLPVEPVQPVMVQDYREELMLTLSTARQSALESINRAQTKYKTHYDRKAAPEKYRVGDWVLLRFPSEESGKQRKLSRPWHGPYRIISANDTNITAGKVYFPRDNLIKVHQSRVKPCPQGFMAGYYWYGNKRKGPGRPPKWVEKALAETPIQDENTDGPSDRTDDDTARPSSDVTRTTDLAPDPPQETRSSQERERSSQRYSLRKNPLPPQRLQ